MQPLSLTLKGFRGIRDGLGLQELTLDVDRLADGASLVAIAGANGRGKTTVLDNLHPFLTMPSRAASAGSGGFSFYEHVFLPESEKQLMWTHGGRRYRSQVVIRLGGRRRTEAFLHELSDGGVWEPVALGDGTVSDGKVETYNRCVEHLCGSAETFFTSMFSSQGKRHLSALRNAEVKSLLADLLGQDAIRELGQKALETTRLLKAGLQVKRQVAAAIDEETARLTAQRRTLEGAGERAAAGLVARDAARARLEAAQQEHVRLVTLKQQQRDVEQQRVALVEQRGSAERAARQAEAAVIEQPEAEAERLRRLDARDTQCRLQAQQRRRGLDAQRQRCSAALVQSAAVRRAVHRLPLAERAQLARNDGLAQAREQVAALAASRGALQLLGQRLAGIEREAGLAALKAEDLSRRFGLTRRVPCSGTDLQGRCELLSDAREAHALLPDANAVIRRLAEQKAVVERDIALARSSVEALTCAEALAQRAERRARRASARTAGLALLAARSGEVEQALASLAAADAELSGLPSLEIETVDERREREGIVVAQRAIARRREQQSAQGRQSLCRIDEALARLPAAFDERLIERAVAAKTQAAATRDAAERAHLAALKDAQALVEALRREAALRERRAATATSLKRVEHALGDWSLLARGLSNDGLIALAIDDAGPELSGLANRLLLACYGPRFSLAIRTQVDTAKGEQKEGFDIVVHDAESGQSKSMAMMSGGERVWINECLVRAVALYLAQSAGRRYSTLFSDESDGALDAERKRMFMAMKREVLRLGGYEREFFISQTPELASMADAVIDLERYAVPSREPATAAAP